MNAQNFSIPFSPIPSSRIVSTIRWLISYAFCINGLLGMTTSGQFGQVITILKPKPRGLLSLKVISELHVYTILHFMC